MSNTSQATRLREELPRETWQQALEGLTESHQAYDVTIELVSPTLGDQEQAEKLPFASAAYDPKDDVVIIAVGGREGRYPVELRHMVWRPRQLFVHPPAPALAQALDVVDAEGTQTIVTFHLRPALPPPA